MKQGPQRKCQQNIKGLPFKGAVSVILSDTPFDGNVRFTTVPFTVLPYLQK